MITRSIRPGCPDCSATFADGKLIHDSTCPLGGATDERMAEDRRWFEKYPNAEGFTRPLTRAEVDELRTAGVIPSGWAASGTVIVTQLAPGVRTRDFSQIRMWPPGFGPGHDRSLDVECARLADEALTSGEPVVGDDFIAVPDLVLAEFMAASPSLTSSFALLREDGRKCDFFRRPPEWLA